MAKLMLMKKNEISVPEEKKGKQIAVKENNITALKDFFLANYNAPQESVSIIENSAPKPEEEKAEIDQIIPEDNSIINQQNILEENANIPENVLESSVIPEPIIPPSPILDEPTINLENESQNNLTEENSETGNEQAINLVIENESNNLDNLNQEELDPELQEIKTRLDKVIEDLNNYKKKIKILENEVNQNLEKSREVLKDTQAAAKIMSIQQERQREINEEITGGSSVTNDSTRILQKNNVA